MATSTNSFGSNFDAAAIRQKLTDVMNMGLPEDVGERATFRWKTEYQNTITAPSGKAYDFTATPVATDAPADVQIPVAVEFLPSPPTSRFAVGTPMGEFDNARAVITILDTYYPQVATADQVLLGDNIYNVEFWAPPIGLFDLTVYQVYLSAQDET